jgi:molybdopterin-containing oxidoreductase family iron-sulfur binding subunit
MPAELTNAPNDSEPEFWQSIDQWMDGPQFRDLMRDEFPDDAAEWLDPVSRRQFLALSAAGVALATGCNPSFKPASQRKVVPYVKQPEHVIPNVPLFFATAAPQQGGVGLGLIVKQQEGRPIKVEGNPQHPGSLGGCNLAALASPLDLYDPDRSKSPVSGPARVSGTFEKAVAAVKQHLAAKAGDGGAGVRLLTEPTTSPTQIALIEKLLERYPKAKWVQYEAATRDNARKAAVAAFGRPLNVVYNLAVADVVLALDADFLATGPGAVRYAREFGQRRRARTSDSKAALKANDGVEVSKKKVELNRLYAVEGMVTSTGAVADHRLPLKPSEVEAFARGLAAKLGVAGVTAPAGLSDLAQKWIEPLAKDLQSKAGKAVVIVGDHQTPATHLLALAINEKLGAFGTTVTFTAPLDPQPSKPTPGFPGEDSVAELKKLADEVAAGQVTCLLMSGVNPVYDAPADLAFAATLETARKQSTTLVLHHGLYQDETAAAADWHLNSAHYLEAWGDVRGHDGTVSVQQPLIAPLYSGKSLIEFLGALLDIAGADGLSLVQATQRDRFTAAKKSGSFDRYWEEGLKNGVLADTALAVEKPAKPVGLEKLAEWKSEPIKGLEIQFRPDPALFDGKQANNGWLQELPKPITNLCWDNAAIVSPKTAAELKVQHGYTFNTYKGGERGATETDIAEVTVNGRKLAVAVHILPAHADDVITLHLGYGRTRAGRVASPADGTAPGFDANKLRSTDALWSAAAKLERTNQRHILAVAGAYHAMESRRPVRWAAAAQFVNDPEFAQVPPVAAAETHAIRQNTPGTPENFKALGLKHPHDHHGTHTHADGTVHEGHDEHEHEPHDKRVIPLSLYNDNPIRVTPAVPGGQKDDPNKTYRRWAMAIDLGSCTGCGACTLACQAENNIPVVGKEQVNRGRAMHWIRIDRYYSIPGKKLQDDDLGDAAVGPADRAERVKRSADIRVHVQPVPCQQCEKAPCEVVCPVGATVHSADGLNDMAYNRCVGTRYCSNNCPYKVRRFNFLQYADYSTDSMKLLNNPEVSVRTRGVMEKCTYCVQRIRNAEIEAEREWNSPARPKDVNGRPKILDGEVITACQQACPTGSIAFGDMSDPDAAVLRWKAEPHTYGLLAELNTMPRTTYLAAIRNPNEDLVKALAAGKGA